MDQLTPAILAGPAGIPPPGVLPLNPHPENTGHILIIVSTVVVALMLAFVGNRFYVKIFISRQWGWDDVTCVISVLFTLLFYGIDVYGVQKCYIGVHQYDITLEQYLDTKVLVNFYLNQVLVAPAFMILKLTFFILFLQLFWPMTWLRVAIWIGIALNVFMYIGWGIAAFAIATPGIHETWQAHFTGKTINKGNTTAMPVPATSLALDIYILLIPLIGVRSLQLTPRRKIAVAIIFLTGILAIVASSLRIVYTIPILSSTGTGDLTHYLMPVYTTIIVELALGVIVTCMPTFAHLLRKNLPASEVMRSKFSSAFGRSGRSGGVGAKYQSGYSKDSTGLGSKPNAKSEGFVQVTDAESASNLGWEMHNYKPVKTYVSAGKNRHIDDDNVHLKYEVTQESHAVLNGSRDGHARSPVGSDMV